MIAPFDLFRQESDGTIIWLGAVEELEAAKAKARELIVRTPGTYFVFSQTSGNKMYIKADDMARCPTRAN